MHHALVHLWHGTAIQNHMGGKFLPETGGENTDASTVPLLITLGVGD